MDSNRERNRDRAKSAAGVALCHALLGYALITGLAPGTAARAGEALKLFDVSAEPLPAPPHDRARAEAAPEREGAASPTNLRVRPTPLVAPPPKLPADPPVVAAPAAGEGSDVSAGSADRPGPGSGSGGQGAGTGSGRAGGGPGGGGLAARAELIAGRILDSDYPRAASRARIGGTVIVRFTVGADGRPGGCAVVRSSGRADLDSTTCRLIERRFRYRPARDSEGKAVAATMGWKQIWWQEPR
jgi:periplasmic protein TonB